MIGLKRFLISLLLLTFYTQSSIATIRLELKKLPNSNYDVNVSGMPVFKANIKALKNDIKYNLKVNQLVIIEDNRIAIPFSISELTDGWQELIWITTTKGYNQVNTLRIIATVENESAAINGTYSTPNYARVLIRDTEGQQIEDASYGTVPANSSAWIQVYVNPYIGKKNSSGFEMPLRIDSITNTSPYIKMKWQGNAFNRKPPPVTLDLGSFNLVDLDFFPETNEYVRDIFTVHYEGGMKEELTLTANHHSIQKNQLLQLIQPNGNEFLAPCQNYKIIWKGNSREIPTIIEFSSDAGKTWNYIGQSYDTLFNWTVPKSYSENCQIRVRQEFKSISEKYLNAGTFPVERLAFNSKGSKLINAMNNGVISEFDMITFQKSEEYYLSQSSPTYNVRIFGLAYLASDSSFVVSYENQSPINKPDSLAFFKVGQSQPYLRIGIDEQFDVKKMYVDASQKIIALSPAFDNKILLFNTTDGTFVKAVYFPYVIQTFTFNPALDTASVYLLNGELRLLSLPDFTTIDSIDLRREPFVIEMGLSPDGKYAALGTKTPKITTTTNTVAKNYILDLKTKNIIRTTRNTASDSKGLEFNPTSNVLLIGSEFQPQLALWDLITGTFIGTLGGSIDAINDFKFSPEGHSLAFSSGNSSFVTIKTFTYPEQDESDKLFSIREPKLLLEGDKVSDTYLAIDNLTNFKNAICNTGEVQITFDLLKFKNGIHFQLIEPIAPITLLPGECRDVKFIFHPLDTGMITDSIVITSNCFGEYIIPVESNGLKRNLTFLTDVFEFDETCIGEIKDKNFNIIRNDDPVPVIINTIGFVDAIGSPFTLLYPLIDTVLQPNQLLNYPIRFHPHDTGTLIRNIAIYHSNQTKMIPLKEIRGKGIGIILDISHQDLLFIPEILNRKLKLKNKSNTNVIIESATITPSGNFTVLTNLPFQINIGDSAEIEVEWNGLLKDEALLELKASPCITDKSVKLGFYSALSQITIPYIEADPHLEIVIPISFSNVESKSYNGIRFFEANIFINPRMFFPVSVTSPFGTGSIIKNEVVDDKRIIGLRVAGDFPNNGIVAEIKGIAGLAETDTSSVVFDSVSIFWGKSVNVNFTSGFYRLIEICDDRFLYRINKNINIINIIPNPAEESSDLIFETNSEMNVDIEIYNSPGLLVYERKNIAALKGLNISTLDLSHLTTGYYRITIRNGNSLSNNNLIIIR